jgi:rod shape-determining protein MreC
VFSRNQVQRRRAVLAVLLAVSLVLLTVYFNEPASGALHAIQRGASEVLSPIEEGAARIFKPFGDLAGWVGDVADAKKQNKQLKTEVRNLHQQLATLAVDEREYEQLRALAGLEKNFSPGTKTVAARVIAHSPTVWYSTIEIDKGTGDGIRANDPVLTAGGLAGRVVDTTGGTARIALITDSSSNVAAEVVPGGAQGIVKPEVGGRTLILDFIPKGSRLHRGDVVVTSGFRSGALQSLFPRGIPIGKVGAVNPGDLEIYQRVNVHPYADLRRMDFVSVIVSSPKPAVAGVRNP